MYFYPETSKGCQSVLLMKYEDTRVGASNNVFPGIYFFDSRRSCSSFVNLSFDRLRKLNGFQICSCRPGIMLNYGFAKQQEQHVPP